MTLSTRLLYMSAEQFNYFYNDENCIKAVFELRYFWLVVGIVVPNELSCSTNYFKCYYYLNFRMCCYSYGIESKGYIILVCMTLDMPLDFSFAQGLFL